MRTAARVDAKRIASIANFKKATQFVKDRIRLRPMWVCARCGVERIATAHQMRQKYCSKTCMSDDYKLRMSGDGNPNRRIGCAKRACLRCGSEFTSYNKGRKYCSRACYSLSKIKLKYKQLSLKLVKAKEVKEKAVRKLVYSPCFQCGNEIKYFPSAERKYCSYRCFIESGGAFRAGIAAREKIMKYGAKKDANHNEIIEEMRKYCAVYDLSSMGMGVPDGIAWSDNNWRLFDIKNPKTSYGRKGLNKIQKKWIQQWKGGPVYLIYTVEQARRFGQGCFDGIKYEMSGYMIEDSKEKDAA